jgi:hypothetical protein
MKFNFKKTLIVIVLVLLILSCYFYMHFPIGTFNYSNGKNREFSIKIQISEQLGTMFEPVYNLSVIIQSDNLIFEKKFETCDDNLNLLLMRKGDREFIILENSWSGFCKCESNKCGDFFHLGEGGYSIDPKTNQEKYITNYQDSIKGDTINFIRFEELKFKRIK